MHFSPFSGPKGRRRHRTGRKPCWRSGQRGAWTQDSKLVFLLRMPVAVSSSGASKTLRSLDRSRLTLIEVAGGDPAPVAHLVLGDELLERV